MLGGRGATVIWVSVLRLGKSSVDEHTKRVQGDADELY